MATGPLTQKNSRRASALGAAGAVAVGLLLWATSLGEGWVNASYDYLFRFGDRAPTNHVSLILMDNAAFAALHQTRGQPWDRALHAQLLERLAADGCRLVVLDAFLRAPRDPAADARLAAALATQRSVVLMAEQAAVTHPGVAGVQPLLPAEIFLQAARTNWGVAWLDPDLDGTVRRHWPFPSPTHFPSLPEAVARAAGATPPAPPAEKWLRFYGPNGNWPRLGYAFSLAQPAGYFRDQIVFIGTQPQTSVPGDGETDEFRTPYTRWTGESVGGSEILITATLNLINRDWLRRAPAGAEGAVIMLAGAALGGGLARLRRRTATLTALAAALAVTLGAVLAADATNCWFPWLVIVGGQLPWAWAWAVLRPQPVAVRPAAAGGVPKIPGYELVSPPIGEGAYGRVWLARQAGKEWVALKVVYRSQFGEDPAPYAREFAGIIKYQPLSHQHSGLLRVTFVSEQLPAGYFYYAMELGDAQTTGWEAAPENYRPKNLATARALSPQRRLPVRDCVRLGLGLTAALEYLHQQGLTHRDIKPQNIIFVNGQPKLADMGLITEIRPPDQERTLVGTPGFMPPPPERPGTPQADIYALGMVLYVASTGLGVGLFPEIATSLVHAGHTPEFLPLNNVILKACRPDPADRFASAAEMRAALVVAEAALKAAPAGLGLPPALAAGSGPLSPDGAGGNTADPSQS